MKYLVSLFLVLLTYGCATSDKEWKVYSDAIATDMAPLNVRLRGNWVRKEKIKDFSLLSHDDYVSSAKRLFDPSEKEFKEFLTNKDTSLVFKGLERDFVVCAKNINLHLVLCDKASSGMVDFVSKDVDIELSSKAESLLLIKN